MLNKCQRVKSPTGIQEKSTYLDWLGPNCEFVENSTKQIHLEISGVSDQAQCSV